MIATRSALLVQFLDGAAELLKGGGVIKCALDEADSFGQLLPGLLAEGGACVLAHGVVDDLGEIFAAPFAARESREGEGRRQQTAIREVVHGRHELLPRKISRHAEHHETA
jgi:hypothetical protein